jgi:CubicO group peptidase (beta-lactamase class C family)
MLLAHQGKLSLDDDVRKHLPWFPDLKEKITIRHLLTHTSGIRDQWQLLAMSGTRLDDVITQAHVIKLLGRQQALNFKPGDRFLYCNSGYTLMAEIVRAISGRSLRAFADSALFKPLGMTSTHFHDDYTEVVPNRAQSYSRGANNRFSNSVLSYSIVGPTSLFSNIEDMGKWMAFLSNPNESNKPIVGLLAQTSTLNNGEVLKYGGGVFVDSFKGWTQIAHSGGDAGFRSHVVVFPDLKMGVVILGNIGSGFFPDDKAYKVADLLITPNPHPAAPPVKDNDLSLPLPYDTVAIRKYAGNYLSEEGLAFVFSIKGGMMYVNANNKTLALKKNTNDSFHIQNAGVTFRFRIRGKDTTAVVVTPDQVYYITKFPAQTPVTDTFLKAYTGTYYSPELDCRYYIILKDHQLLLTHPKYPDVPLKLVNKDHLTNDAWYMSHLKITRNKKNEVAGFEVSAGRVMHVRFEKIP